MRAFWKRKEEEEEKELQTIKPKKEKGEKEEQETKNGLIWFVDYLFYWFSVFLQIFHT